MQARRLVSPSERVSVSLRARGLLCARRRGDGRGPPRDRLPSRGRTRDDRRGGIVLGDKRPASVAEAVGRLLDDPGLWSTLATAGRQRAGDFALSRTEPSMWSALEGVDLMTPTITFVSPRYGADVVGGAEQGPVYATRMAAEGWNIRVLSSCALECHVGGP